MLIKSWQYKQILENVDTYSSILIHGMNNGLVREKSVQLVKYLEKKFQNSLDIIETTAEHFSGESNSLQDLAYQKSMFSLSTIIKVNLSDVKNIDGFITQLKELDPTKANFILIESEAIKSNAKILKYFNYDKKVLSLPCYLENDKSIKESIINYAKQYSLLLNSSSIDYLSTKLGNDTLITKQEIKKLALYANGKQITFEETLKLSGDNSSLDLNKLCDSYLVKETKETLMYYDRLLVSGVNNFLILRSFLKHFHMLLDLKRQSDAFNIKNIKPAIHFSRHNNIENQIRNIRSSKLVSLILAINKLEIYCKLNPEISNITTKRFLILSSL